MSAGIFVSGGPSQGAPSPGIDEARNLDESYPSNSLGGLLVELFFKILGDLSTKQIIENRQVCKKVKHIIDAHFCSSFIIKLTDQNMSIIPGSFPHAQRFRFS